MRNGDLGNFELPRMWFVVEGIVLLPTKAKRKKHAAKHVRDDFELSVIAMRRVWDLVWRYDFRVNLVTFEQDPDYVAALQEWLDAVDYPAPLYSFSLEEFMDTVVVLPSCYAVFDADARRAFMYGGKGVHVDAHTDFDPIVMRG